MRSPAAPNEFEVLLSALSADLAALRADVTELKRSHRSVPRTPPRALKAPEAVVTVNLASVLPRVPPRGA